MKKRTDDTPPAASRAAALAAAIVFTGWYMASLATERQLKPFVASIVRGAPFQDKPGSGQGAYPKPVQDMMDRKTNEMWNSAGEH